MFSRITIVSLFTVLLVALLAACSGPTVTTGPAPSPAETGAPVGAASATPLPAASPTPTATAEPLALRVNGEGITLAEFQAELSQLGEALQAQGRELAEDVRRQQVIDALVDNLLLAQGAAEAGYTLDDAALQAEIDRLAGQRGGAAALSEWQARNGYNDATFRAALRRSMAAAWQRDQLAEGIPAEAEQVHARQILTLDEGSAQTALQRVQVPGANFATVAFMYDSQIGGDLGWFPRGYLTQSEVEAAAFALQPGDTSEIIQSQVGYHILQIIAREVRPLSPDARRALQRAAISGWLAQRRGASTIEIIN